MAMLLGVLTLACIVCIGQSRRVQRTSEQLQGSLDELHQNALGVDAADKSSGSLKQSQSGQQGGEVSSWKRLAVLLRALDPAVGWSARRGHNSATSSPGDNNLFGSHSIGIQRDGQVSASKASMPETTGSVTSKDSEAASHPAYDVSEVMHIEEYGLHMTMYKHRKTGAQVISVIAPEDANKVFGIVFRTPPEDSTGLPHILEHSVLCGSRKFPVKDPFNDMSKGSLNTFLNAFTYPDRTCYPVASMNTKDFYNLIHVYLDAVFHPRAISDPQVMQQEGWHYELEDPSKPLAYNGVVYNEMKGVYSSPDSIMGTATQQALFPDNTYGVDSGGDPRHITDLDFKQFKDFHSKYYHPSNARVFFYGDDDPLKRLELLDEYLSEFDHIQVDSTIKYQKKMQKEKRLEIRFPVQEDDSDKHMVTVNWLLNDERISAEELMALNVLDTLLLGRTSSPLYRKLIESGLGEGLTGGGLSDELLQATFSVGLKGVRSKDVRKVASLVQKEVARLAKVGFDEGDVKAALNTLEFSLREFNAGSYPRGLMLMLSMLNRWNYDQDPADGVRFETSLQKLKDDIAAGKHVFQDLLQKYFVSNKHKVVVEMKPDPELEKVSQEREEKALQKTKEAMSPSDIEEVMEVTRKLKEAQAAEDLPEAKATIPRLGLEDIEREVQTVPIEVEKRADGVQVITHELQTSGILYAEVGFDFSSIKEEDLVLLPLLTRMLTESGTKDLDEVQLGRRIGSETGGIGISTLTDAVRTSGTLSDLDNPLLYLLARGKATKDKIGNLFGLIRDILLDSRLDNKRRAIEILKETKVYSEDSVISSGHSYGVSRLAARRSLLGYIGEAMGGLTFARNSATLLKEAEADWGKVQARLEALRDMIVQKGDVVINLTGSKDVIEAAKLVVEEFIGEIPVAGAKEPKLADLWSNYNLLADTDEGFSMPTQVNYVVKSVPLLQPGEAVKGSYYVASRFLSNGYFWDNVRVMGGAYGGFASFSPTSGCATFISYRDPNVADTLAIYDQAADFLAEEAAKISDEELLLNIIGAIGDLDQPMTADTKGFVSLSRYLTKYTTEDRQRFRDEILSTSREDILDFATKLRAMKSSGSTVVFGSQAALDGANEVLPADHRLEIEPAILA